MHFIAHPLFLNIRMCIIPHTLYYAFKYMIYFIFTIQLNYCSRLTQKRSKDYPTALPQITEVRVKTQIQVF